MENLSLNDDNIDSIFEIITLRVKSSQKVRLDFYIAQRVPYSRSFIKKLILKGNVLVDKRKITKPSYNLNFGQEIEIYVPEIPPFKLVPEDVPFKVVYEDEHIIVVNKPSGIVTHPAPGNWNKTLLNGLLYRYPDISKAGGEVRPGIVHRLDKETSGLLIIARTPKAHKRLVEMFSKREIKKFYVALVWGSIFPPVGEIDAPIGRNPYNRKKMTVIYSGKEAITKYKLLKNYGKYSLVECRPITGRTHQIRVHLAYKGHPIVGDTLYSKRKHDISSLNRLFLHAYKLIFNHPIHEDKTLNLKAVFPQELSRALASLT